MRKFLLILILLALPTLAFAGDCSPSDYTCAQIETLLDTVNSGVQPLEATLTDIADGTIAENLVNTTNPWADNEVANKQTLDLLRLPLTTSEPGDEAVGDLVKADISAWNPAGLDTTGDIDYYAICTATGSPGTWKALFNVAASWKLAGIPTPTLDTDELDDDATPSVLLTSELQNTKLSNASSGEDWVYTLPEHAAADDDWYFQVVIEAAFQITLAVHANDTVYLNGTALAQGEDIINDDDTIGESMICYSTEVRIYCESKYANFTEASP